MTPSTATHLAIVALFVVPGIVYQAVRARLAGESPQNRDTANKILRAVAASVVFAGVYLLAVGPLIIDLFDQPGGDLLASVSRRPRTTGAFVLTLLFLVPAGAALVAARRWAYGERLAALRGRGLLDRTRRVGRSALGRALNAILHVIEDQSQAKRRLWYDPTPTAWDWAVAQGASGFGFVRVLGKDGKWRGGAFSANSYFTAFPEPPAIYVEQAWQLDDTGAFVAAQEGSRGVWIPCAEAVAVEFANPGDRGGTEGQPEVQCVAEDSDGADEQ